MNLKIVIVSGGFDPVHVGHIRMFRDARVLGDRLVVILNNDNWLMKKKGFVFMTESERAEILRSVKYTDIIFTTTHEKDDSDTSVSKAIEAIVTGFKDLSEKVDANEYSFVFANGGDRIETNTPEVEMCQKLNVQMVYNVGGEKIQSSSELIKNVRD